VIALSDRPAVARLFRQLERGLEEVHEQAERRIEPCQRRRCAQPLVASVANRVPNDRAVLLLDPGLVVLAIRTASRELHARCLAVVPHGLVHEHAVVVRVEPKQRERKQLAQLSQHLGQQILFAHQQRRALRPSRGDVGQRQGLHEASLRRRPAMRNQVRLDKAGWRVRPSPRRCAPRRYAGSRPTAACDGVFCLPLAF